MARIAKRIGFLLIKTIGDFVLPQITDALLRCLEIGFENTINSLVEDGPLADVQARIAAAQGDLAGLQEDFTQDIETVVNNMIGPFETELRALARATEFIGSLVQLVSLAVNAARLAFCVAGGVESAGISCVVSGVDWLLGLVGLSPTEALAGYLMDTCFAKEHMAEAMLAMGEVRNIPVVLAQSIIRGVRDNLPPPLRSLICNPEDIANDIEMPSAEDIACPEGGSGVSGDGGTNVGPAPGAQGQTPTGTDSPVHDVPGEGEGSGDDPTSAPGESEEAAGAGTGQPSTTTRGANQTITDGDIPNGTSLGYSMLVTSGIDLSSTYDNTPATVTLVIRTGDHVYQPFERDVVIRSVDTSGDQTIVRLYFTEDFVVTEEVADTGDGQSGTRSISPTPGSDHVYRGVLRQ